MLAGLCSFIIMQEKGESDIVLSYFNDILLMIFFQRRNFLLDDTNEGLRTTPRPSTTVWHSDSDILPSPPGIPMMNVLSDVKARTISEEEIGRVVRL